MKRSYFLFGQILDIDEPAARPFQPSELSRRGSPRPFCLVSRAASFRSNDPVSASVEPIALTAWAVPTKRG
jgi:hypothetical protein